MHHVFQGEELAAHVEELEGLVDVELLLFQQELAVDNVLVAFGNLIIVVQFFVDLFLGLKGFGRLTGISCSYTWRAFS